MIWYITTFNRYQSYIIRINEAEANIDSILRKRYDLLNKSRGVIKSNTEEKKVLEELAGLRSKKLTNFELDRKIYDAIKRLLNSLTEKGRQKNAYYDFVSELEQKWREAYKQTTTERAINNLKRNTKYHLSENARKEILDAFKTVII